MGRSRFSNIYDINAPPEAVWEVLTDIQSYPQTFREIQSVQPITSVDPIRVGTKFSQQVSFIGARFTVYSTITDLEVNPDFPRSLSIASTHGDDFKDLASTETHMIQRNRESEDRTTWIFITAQQVGGVWDRLKFSILSCCLHRRVGKIYENMSRDVENASIARMKEKPSSIAAIGTTTKNNRKEMSHDPDSSASTDASNNSERKAEDNLVATNEDQPDANNIETTSEGQYDGSMFSNTGSSTRKNELVQINRELSSPPVTTVNLTNILRTRKKLSEQGLPKEEIDLILPILGTQELAKNKTDQSPIGSTEEENSTNGSVIVNLTSLLQNRKELADRGVSQDEIDLVLPIFSAVK